MTQEFPANLGEGENEQTIHDVSVVNSQNVTFNQTQIIQISVDVIKTSEFEITSPYKGLKKFEPTDKLFFGRDQFLTGLVNELEQTNLILLLGASGSGKSSVIRAGLIPWLVKKQGGHFVPLIFTPDQDPFESLYASLLGKYKQSEAKIARIAKEDTLTQIVRSLKQKESYWFILIDQFEELFFPTVHLEQRDVFIASLVQLMKVLEKAGDRSVKVVATMRADFLDRLSPYPALVKATDKHRPMIAEMQLDELRLAIEQPAAHNGVVFETGLVKEIIENVQGQAGYLPLLQYTLDLLWKEEVKSSSIQDRTLNISNYRELGGVRGALQKHVENIYGALPESDNVAVQRIFLKLVGIGEDEKSGTEWKPVRRRANRSEFSDPLEQKVLSQLIDQNLLVSNRASGSQESIVEIAHEALLTSWTTLNTWIKENRQSISLRNRLNDDVAQWKKTKSKDDLWTGSRLEKALELRLDETFNNVLGGLDPEANRFINLSRGERDNQRRRTILGLASFSGIALILALLAGWQWNQAEDRKDIARSVQLATAAEASLETDTTRSLILALMATQVKPTSEAKRSLGAAFQANYEQLYLKHSGSVTYGEYDPNNTDRVLTISDDGTAKIWNMRNFDSPCILRGHSKAINYGQFNPNNSSQVLTVSDDSTAIVWNIDKCRASLVLKGHSAPIHSGSFDPKNANRVLTASSDKTVMIWDLTNPHKPMQTLRGHTGEVWKAEFDPTDSNRVLTVSSDGTAKIWNLKQPSNSLTLSGHQGQIVYGCFDPKNSNRVLTVSDDKTARVWNLDKVGSSIILIGHQKEVIMGAFNPDDPNQVVTVSQDRTARLWNLGKPNESIVLRSSITQISHASFNPNNSSELLVVGSDGSVGKAEVWDVSTLTVKYSLIGHTKEIRYGTFNPDHPNQILTVGDDGTGRIWRTGSKSIFEVPRKQGIIVNAEFIANEEDQVVLVNKDGLVQRWKIDKRELVDTVQLKVSFDSIINAAFNPRNTTEVITIDSQGIMKLYNLNSLGDTSIIQLRNDRALNVTYSSIEPRKVLVATEKGVITIHDTSKPDEEPLVLSVLPARLTFGQFNPKDSNEIITASDDGVMRIWNLNNLDKPQTERRVNKEILWFAGYAPSDPEIVFAGGRNKRLWLWNLRNDESPLELDRHKGVLTYASINPKDSSQIITAGQDEFTHIWNLDSPSKLISIREPGEEVIYSIFNPQNPNQVLTLSESGRLRIYLIGGKYLFNMSYFSLSRCLTSVEVKENRLTKLDISRLTQSINASDTSKNSNNHKPYCSNEEEN